jgi:hypothetical protein
MDPLLQASDEPGDVSEVPREDEGADGSAHAEDQGDVGKYEEIREHVWH